MASVAPLLQKLDPMTMMEDGGLQRASIAIKLLAQKAATDPSLGGGILEAKGMRYATQGSNPQADQQTPGRPGTHALEPYSHAPLPWTASCCRRRCSTPCPSCGRVRS
jgi:hypothetical protein